MVPLFDQKTLTYHSPSLFGYYYLQKNQYWHQQKALDILSQSRTHKRYVLFLMPRGHGKTITILEVFPTWMICTNAGGTVANPRILLISEAEDNSIKRLTQIKTHLYSPKIIRDFGDQRDYDKEWLKTRIYCNRTQPYIDPTVEAVGISGSITGGHFNAILLDDPCSLKNMESETMRLKHWQWLTGTVMPMLEPGGILAMLGTRKNYFDMYYMVKKLAREGAPWEVIEIPAYLDDAHTQALWPQKYPVSELQQLELALGPSTFAREYMNSPVPLGGLHFKTSWLQWVPNELVPYQSLRYMAWLDPAFSKSDISCNNAIAIVGISQDNKVYVLDMVRFHGDMDMMFNQVHNAFNDWPKLEVMWIESNFHQHIIPDAINKISLLPVMGVEQHRDKIARIQSLEPFYAAGRVFHRDVPNIRNWVDEEYLTFYTKDGLVDGLDALASCVEQAVGYTWQPGVFKTF